MPQPSESPSPASPRLGFAARNLACRRGERLVFEGLSFILPPGAALILRGPNGSGKSSLLRVLAGLTPPAAGTLTWDGEEIHEDREKHRRRLQFVGHADALKLVLSAAENLGFWAGMRARAPVEPAQIGATLAQFGLGKASALPCRYLSAGQRRRLALARLTLSSAELWLLDEPFSGLDADGAAQLLTAIAAHRAGGGRIVISTHAPLDLAQATSLSLADFRPAPDRTSEAVA